MDLLLLDPHSVPERLEGTLPCSSTPTCCEFNRDGNYLAVGCGNGETLVFDFLTRGVAKRLVGHARAVSSVSWTRNSRHILTCSVDMKLKYWDVQSATPKRVIDMEQPLVFAQIHPKSDEVWLVCPLAGTPFLVNATSSASDRRPLLPTEQSFHRPEMKQKYDMGMVATFDKKGTHVLIGGSKGVMSVVDRVTLQVETEFTVPGSAKIRSIRLCPDGKYYVLNSADRTIRLVSLQNHNIIRDFQDPVNHTLWRRCCFSSDGEHVLAGSAENHSLIIYVWNTSDGRLVQQLTGPRETLLDFAYHPRRCFIAACAANNIVYIWASDYDANWAAFAPNFEELEENEEYIEKEDEFDMVPDEEMEKQKRVQEDEEVDIITVDRHLGFSTDSDLDIKEDTFVISASPPRDNEATIRALSQAITSDDEESSEEMEEQEKLATQGSKVSKHAQQKAFAKGHEKDLPSNAKDPHGKTRRHHRKLQNHSGLRHGSFQSEQPDVSAVSPRPGDNGRSSKKTKRDSPSIKSTSNLTLSDQGARPQAEDSGKKKSHSKAFGNDSGEIDSKKAKKSSTRKP